MNSINNEPQETKFATPVEAISTKELLVKFLKDTKEWDGINIEREYIVSGKSASDVMKLVNNIRVSISRIRSMYRINKKAVPPFRFTSRIDCISEANENGYSTYKLTLGKANAASTTNRQLIEDLL